MKKAKIAIVLILVAVLIAGFSLFKGSGKASDKKSEAVGKTILLKTSMGDIKIKLYGDMPMTAGNFEKLVSQNFYDGTIIHRVIDGFMIQGGDPTGTGRGGPGYAIKDEFNSKKNVRGTIAMANAGPDTGGSQFFINLVDNPHLDGKHPVFGEVLEGMDVVDRITKVKTDSLYNKPLEPVTILSAEIVE